MTVAAAIRILGLIIAGHGVKPALAMKRLSKTFRFVVLGVIVTVAVVGCCTFPFCLIKDTKSCFELGNCSVDIGHWPLANRKDDVPIYVPWKNEDKFKAALERVCGHQGLYDVFIQRDNNEKEHWKKNCNPNPRNIRTVKVTKSKIADMTAAGQPAVNDPHVTYKVQSPDPGDIVAVLGTLQSPAR